MLRISKEEWKPIHGYEGKYEVNPNGRVRSLKYAKSGTYGEIRQSLSNSGYLQVTLYKHNVPKVFYVHRLVAEHFIAKEEGRDFIDHINGDRTDNSMENLRWCTRKENQNFPLAKAHASAAHLGYRHSEQTKRKMSVNNTGKGNPMYGRKHSEESKAKISIANTNPSRETRRKVGLCHRHPISMFDKHGNKVMQFDSVTDAAGYFNTSRQCISHCLSPKCPQKAYKGFTFKYVNNVED